MNKLNTLSGGGRPRRTVALMMGATLLSKILGMLRSVLMSQRYGTTYQANAFSEALHIPLTFFDLLFGAAVLGCFIPVFNSFGEDKRGAGRFCGAFMTAVLTATGALTLLGFLFAPAVVSLAAPGFDGQTRDLCIRLLRMLFPIVIFTGATYTLVGVMQSGGRYLLPALVSSVSNGCVVVYLAFFDQMAGEAGIYVLALVYLLSWLAQMLTLLIPLWISGQRIRLNMDFRTTAFRRALKTVPPIMIGSWLIPAGLLAGMSFCSLSDVPGAVTVFDYAHTIYLMIAGILTYSICNYVFPLLSRRSTAGDSEGFAGLVRNAVMAAMLIVLPFTAGAAVLSGEGVAILYLRGEFTPADAVYTAQTLRVLIFAMPAFALNELLSRVFYSRNEVRVPMAAALTGIGVNVALATVWALTKGSLFTSMSDVSLIAAANLAGQAASACVLLGASIRRIPGVFDRAFAGRLLIILLFAALSGAVMMGLYRLNGNDPFRAGIVRNIGICAAVFVPGVLSFAPAVWISRRGFGRKAVNEKRSDGFER